MGHGLSEPSPTRKQIDEVGIDEVVLEAFRRHLEAGLVLADGLVRLAVQLQRAAHPQVTSHGLSALGVARRGGGRVFGLGQDRQGSRKLPYRLGGMRLRGFRFAEKEGEP